MTTTDTPRSIRIAVLAMGGEGGGVLADWIVDMGEHNGYIGQTTSVPGVAQRTGATIYYIELFPRAVAEAAGRPPVLAMMPVPGDVDIVVASELMEAGRAVQRGIVTPDRTTLIASTHRVFAMTEKIALADGRVDETALRDACRTAARRWVAFDMATLADRAGSVISAVMFGALAGSGSLPFSREAFEATIERGGVGVSASKKAFGLGHDVAQGKEPAPLPPEREKAPPKPRPPALVDEAQRIFPAAAMDIIRAGIERLVDYQDEAYAHLYIDRLKPVADFDVGRGDGSFALLTEVARHLALGMAYEDTIRVAELKIRHSRFQRVAKEVQLKDGQILTIAEFLHPRLQEIAETVPAWLGKRMLADGWLRRFVERMTQEGRIVETTSITGFLQLYAVASLKPRRRQSLRYATEQQHLDAWIAKVLDLAISDYGLALEFAECRNLVKGYGDTHERGRRSFERITGMLGRIAQQQQPARLLAELRAAALADESGGKLTETAGRLGLA
ncbi:indolepyruvate oxidoreductase subunit beta family protein [uncultured Alsobacter sp.]|uniref:indolepyruvate oxidoreductase subunit beta family protein n=1 Tax=uncultured Alsobacter sp. TaxID=1748258 RepID=UPI0025FD9433|nr:indolepyruvate oxidoreductase subunit beta family protein [uncultured Alsobacter sp.]